MLDDASAIAGRLTSSSVPSTKLCCAATATTEQPRGAARSMYQPEFAPRSTTCDRDSAENTDPESRPRGLHRARHGGQGACDARGKGKCGAGPANAGDTAQVGNDFGDGGHGPRRRGSCSVPDTVSRAKTLASMM